MSVIPAVGEGPWPVASPVASCARLTLDKGSPVAAIQLVGSPGRLAGRYRT